MELELDSILGRLREATEEKTDRAMALKLGLPAGTPGNWKKRNSIPFKACFTASQNYGISIDWLLTGEGPKKKNSESSGINLEEFVTAFQEAVVNGIDLSFLMATDDTTEEALTILAKGMHRRLTGEVGIPTSKEEKKQAS